MIEARQHTEHGDREVAVRGEILRTVVGSGVHGIAIPGTDDHDEMGVFIEPPDAVIGVRPPVDHYVYRTQPEGARSTPGDVDLVMYSLRKYLRLAYQGLEIVRDGRLTLPMPEAERERVLRVKRGDVPALTEVLDEIDAVQREVEARLANGRTPLPAEPDWATISAWSVEAHRHHWGWAPAA